MFEERKNFFLAIESNISSALLSLSEPEKLKNILKRKSISFIDSPIYLGYDPPYKFWNRKNEVLFEIN